MHFSVNVHIVNGQQLKFNAVNGQSSKNQHGQRSNAERAGQSFDQQ